MAHSVSRLIIFLLALSIHSIFEGLAIGLQQDGLSLFIGVILHKSIMAFLLGLTLSKATFKPLHFTICILIFAIASPVGIFIGTFITEMKSEVGIIINGVLQAMAGGTFLYITFFEVLNPEFAHSRHKLLKTLSCIIGNAIMAVVIYFSG